MLFRSPSPLPAVGAPPIPGHPNPEGASDQGKGEGLGNKTLKKILGLPVWVPLVVVGLVAALGGGLVGFGLADNRSQIEDLETQLEAAGTEISELKSDLVGEQDRAKNAEEHMALLEEEVAALEQREADLNAYEKELDSRAEQLADLETTLEKRSDELNSAEQKAAEDTFGNGVHLVGVDIQPGTYKSEGADFCYWARLSGTGGSFGESIANGAPDGPGVVTSAGSDAAFESSGCGPWRKTG